MSSEIVERLVFVANALLNKFFLNYLNQLFNLLQKLN